MSEEKLSGSCLCGAVRYEATGSPRRFLHCYCSRCRKVSGAEHASNLFIKGDLNFLEGEALVQSFKVPEAERFTNSFCTQCGSRVPRAIPEFGSVLIPAGSLDSEPSLMPQANIFQGSMAGWSSTHEELPDFEEYPA